MKNKGIFWSSMIAFLISAVSTALITGVDRDVTPLLSNVLAILFWISMLVGFVFCAVLAKRTRLTKQAIPRPFRFFRTKPLIGIDTVFVVSVIGTIVCSILHSGSTILWALLLFLDIAAFEFHILFSISNKEDFSK